MINEITAIYVIIDDRLKATGHCEDGRRQFSDAELITTVIVGLGFSTVITKALRTISKTIT